ncbi:hypothetical protein ACTFIW_001127 [Dictyostelium discoideum]
MAKKKFVENTNWKKIDTDNQLIFEQGGFLGLEEIDPNDYFLTDKNVDKIEKQQKQKQEQKQEQEQQQKPTNKLTTKPTTKSTTKSTPVQNKNQKPVDKKRKSKKGNDDSDNEYSGYQDDSDQDDEYSAAKKKPRIIKPTETVDMGTELLNSFVEGTIHNKKKQRKGIKVKQIIDDNNDNDFEDEKEEVKPQQKLQKQKQQEQKQKQPQKQPQQPQQQPNKKNNKKGLVQQKEEEEQVEEEQEVQQEEEEEEKEIKKPIKEKKVKTQKQIEATKKNINKLEKIKKRKEISEQKTISKEEQDQLDMSEWNSYNLDPLILKGLRSLGFSKPTEIQSSVIPVAVSSGYDVIGAAQTGSGKTLAFGIPMVQRILQHLRKHGQSVENKANKQQNDNDDDENEEEGEEEEEEEGRSKEYRKLFSLVICPTRELAIQVTNHIKSIISHTNLKVISIVGGMASQRQQRVLSKRPEIVVATPGRLWELITEGHQHLVELESLLCLGIDEADRMVEQGHFAELESILKTLPIHRTAMSKKERLKKKETEEKRNKRRKVDKLNNKGEMIKGDQDDMDDQIPDEEMEELEQEEQNHLTTTHKRQTFVFSATLVNIPGDGAPTSQKKKYRKLTPIENLIEKVRFQRDYKLIDVTQKRLTAKNLLETKIFCNLEEKDMYLYYFVERYPGRTLVFVNSIDCARRLIPIFNTLEVPVFALHAQMQQKQRLKNLDRFRTLDNVVLIATDVAARGLDIPLVQHVIHYQVPRTTQLYIHRSGRTARSDQDGISVVLVTPKERPLYIKLDSSIEHDIGNFPTDIRYMEGVRDRIELAKEIDKISHESLRDNREKSWYKKQAEEMDIELDGDFFGENSDDEQSEDTRIAEQKKQFKLKQLRAQLKHLLSRSLLPRGVSQSYITASAIQELETKSQSSAATDFSNKAKNVIGKKAKQLAIENHSKFLTKNKKK